MALGRELPQSFLDAMKLAASILARSPVLVKRKLVDTEAEQIVMIAYRRATGKTLSRVELFMKRDDRFPEIAGESVIVLASLREEGRLLQHLSGFQTFLNHEYEVGPDVLIPRPETEVLVSHAFEELSILYREPVFGIEIGTGSGAISVELLARFKMLHMSASELTPEAEKRARSNAARILGVQEMRFQVGRATDAKDVWGPFQSFKKSPAQFLISNPPYLAGTHEADTEVHTQEPPQALFAPAEDPLFFYREIARESVKYLIPGAPVLLEIPHERAQEINQLFSTREWDVKVLKDLTGRDRVLSAKLKK